MLLGSKRLIAGAFAAVLLAAAAQAEVYIVRLADPPVADYEGGIPGLAATKPAAGQKLDPSSANVSVRAAFRAP